jgi:hypothetical protein
MDKFFWLGLAALIVTGCVGLEPGPEAPSFPVPRAAVGSSAGRLEDPAFAGLAPEARLYLEELAQAFSIQDQNFLVAQGEPQYEAQLRPRYDEGSYLAMLYRTGPWAQDFPVPDDPKTIPGLVPQEIQGIEYVSWEEQGPMLEIQGRLITTKGKAIPCLIVFNPRLREPRILGVYP